jgi:hypothetical protein
MTNRKKPGVAFWATVVVVVVLVAYPLSFGPARAMYVHRLMPEWTYRPMRFFHLPILWALPRMPDEMREPYMAYIDNWVFWLDPVRRN